MEKTATVIFDFDGTLANSVELLFTLYNEHAEEFGYDPLREDEIPGLWHLGYKKALKAKNIRYRKVPKMVMTIGREMNSRMDEVLPYVGIVNVLETLQLKGFSIGVLTSNQAPLVKDFFKKHAFPEFDFVVSEKTLFGKDKALRRIIKRYGLENNQVLYVGDEPRDIAASHKAGVQVIGVTWGLAGEEGIGSEHPPATYTVHTPNELLETILQAAS